MRTRTDVGSVAGGRTIATAARGPLRIFVHAETRGAALLVIASALAVIWANVPALHYETAWGTPLAVTLGRWQLSLPLREWINSGLMAFFFFVVGLEARREADLGELRQARAVLLPLAAGLAGLAAPAAIYLGFTAGSGAGHAWGTAMSTDTAFALGALSLVGPRYADRLRAYIVAVLVFDDLASLIVIAAVYSGPISLPPLLVAVGFFAVVLTVRAAGVHYGPVYAVLGTAMWVAMLNSGVDPLVVGLAIGLLAYASPAPRATLEQASEEFRRFREQPTGAFARRARASLEAAVSPNDRLAALWLPWTTYLVVPLFALANAGVSLTGGILWEAVRSPITLGIVVGYLVGKPIAITGASYLVTRLSRRRLRPPVGWGAVVGAGTAAGIGFTVALLIASLALHGQLLQQAKIGVLATVVLAPLLSAAVFRALDALPQRTQVRALLGDPVDLLDLGAPVDSEVDHIRGPLDAPVTVVEYGDFQCPYCGRAEPVVRELLREFADLTYVWRHLPLDDVHPHARQAAEASEAAAGQGAFWEMHDLLLRRQDQLELVDLVGYASELGLDADRFTRDLAERRYTGRVDRDVESADASGVGGTPTFFINGRRHQGAYDIGTLSAAVKAAGARATLAR
ncbi:MAG TPA: Na+/H+ antiporter NhaA [Blastococcus sp.]